ncbi:hypothetical protein [Bacillus sp. AFS017274]|uniref:hypothetical protein n=1 Tax=Bacillaceae TaxID=186817 RepID=UPI000BF669A9|nr:hypothetical protein [Bacillus sp. AFS017274]PEZ74710.1 hypothetical protein CN380_23615 [Bacillus sp. AFS017274]
MKKWIIILVVIIIAIGTYFAWPKTHLKEPVVMSVQFDEAAKTLAVSYIVEQDDSTYVMEIAHETKGFYPPRSNGDGETDYTQVLAKQNGYELREDIVELTDDQLEYFLSLDGRAVPVDISFEAYSPIETILVLLLKDEGVEVTKQDEALLYTYTAPEDITIDSIGHYDSVATISFEEAVFPLALKKGKSVDVFIHEPYKLSSQDELLIEITTTKDQSYTKHFRLTQSIPKGYLKQIANEANDE